MTTWTHRLGAHAAHARRCLADWARVGELTRGERALLAGGGLATACLLVALAWTCQESVQRGERLRAEQRSGVVVEFAEARRFVR